MPWALSRGFGARVIRRVAGRGGAGTGGPARGGGRMGDAERACIQPVNVAVIRGRRDETVTMF